MIVLKLVTDDKSYCWSIEGIFSFLTLASRNKFKSIQEFQKYVFGVAKSWVFTFLGIFHRDGTVVLTNLENQFVFLIFILSVGYNFYATLPLQFVTKIVLFGKLLLDPSYHNSINHLNFLNL
jgi:hypothetical protein